MTSRTPELELAVGPPPFAFAPGRLAILAENRIDLWEPGRGRRAMDARDARGVVGRTDGLVVVAPGGGLFVNGEPRPLVAPFVLGPERARVLLDGDRLWVVSAGMASAYRLEGDRARIVSVVDVLSDVVAPAGDGSLVCAVIGSLIRCGQSGSHVVPFAGIIDFLAPGPERCLWASVNGDSVALIEPDTGRVRRSFPIGPIVDLDGCADRVAVRLPSEAVVLDAAGRTLARASLPVARARVAVSPWEPWVVVGNETVTELWDVSSGAATVV